LIATYNFSKFALEGFTKSVAREVNPKWNIKFLILSPGGVKTSFVSNMKYVPRHPAYADDPESPLNGLIKYISSSANEESWASPEVCAAVLFDAVVGQNERPLPRRLNLGAETLPIMRADVKDYLKEMDEWEKETLKVSPPQKEGESILNALQR
jgi:NAD(P)-dependent dehydrogenase (short-subunit alcohol dehydrogenase family)